jgi:hypothetical protein
MIAFFPFLTAYDPPGASEGTIDPLGFYQIADAARSVSDRHGGWFTGH